jgi:hypothetical protein
MDRVGSKPAPELGEETIEVGADLVSLVRGNPKRISLEIQNASNPLVENYLLYIGSGKIDPDNEIGSAIAAGSGTSMDGPDAQAAWSGRRKTGETDKVRISWCIQR